MADTENVLVLPVVRVENETKLCPSCDDPVEHWWSYCAMCGWHIAGGAIPSTDGKSP